MADSIPVATVVSEDSDQVKLGRLAKEAAVRVADIQQAIARDELAVKKRIAEIQATTREKELAQERYRYDVDLHLQRGIPPTEAITLVTRLNEREAKLERGNQQLVDDREALNFDRMAFNARAWVTMPAMFAAGFGSGFYYFKYFCSKL
jgi:hypothetical protein